MDSSGLEEFISSTDGLMQVIEQLRGGGRIRLSIDEIDGYIGALMRSAGPIYQTYSLPKEFTVHRTIRLNAAKDTMPPKGDQGPHPLPKTKEDLGPPPSQRTRIGRCHLPGSPVCYCSLYEDTALAELNAQAGEFFSISTFRFLTDILVMPIGEFDYYRRTGQTRLGHAIPESINAYKKLEQDISHQKLTHIRVIDAFIAEEFIRRAAIDTDYKITSTFSKILFDEFPSKIDALVYPSVAFREGLNFAFSVPAHHSKMKLIEGETKIVKITDALGFGIYNYQPTHALERVNPDGSLKWRQEADSSKQ